jgi:MscS family membrane protein
MAGASFFTTAQVIKICVTLGIAAIASVVIGYVFKRLEQRYEKKQCVWRYAAFHAILAPLIVLIWVLAVSLVIPIVVTSFGVSGNIAHYLDLSDEVISILCILWAVMRFIRAVERRYFEQIIGGQSARDRTTIRAFSQIVRCIAIIVAVLTLLYTFSIPIGSLLAVGGIGGIALAFAAKDTLANFLGGMMIFFDKPFSVGDWISSPDRNYDGTVEDIGWRLTRIRTFDKRPLYIPNGTFSTIAVENPSRMTNRRIKTLVAVRYEDAPKLAVIVKESEEMLRNHPDLDTTLTCMVYFTEFADSSLNFLVYTFTKTTDWSTYLAVQQDVFLKIIDIVTQHGAECAFPSRTLYMSDPEALQQPSGEPV